MAREQASESGKGQREEPSGLWVGVCRAEECGVRIGDRYLFCNSHWHMLPEHLRVLVARGDQAWLVGHRTNRRGESEGLKEAVQWLADEEKLTALAGEMVDYARGVVGLARVLGEEGA